MGLRFGRYETVRTIASGGMATVYLGRAVAVGGFERLVAIKVMHPHIAKDPDFQAMFLDEARLAARIRHPNVVGTIDVDKTDQGMFLVMDYVDGPSLHNLRREFRRKKEMLPLSITLRIFVDVLTGLHAAHELTGPDGQPLRLVHRDVSPQNVLVGKDGVSRITDFGVARAEARITSTRGGQLKGKLAYMPSEQVRNERVDRRVDVYAAGVALWEALAGRRLFRADNEAALLHMILEGAIDPPSTHNAQLPEAIERVCMKALRVERDDRYATTAEFADDLEEAAHEADIRIATARKVAAFIGALPPRLSERPAPMTTTPSSMSLADLASAEIAKYDSASGSAAEHETEVETRAVESDVARIGDESFPSKVTTASAVVASQTFHTKAPGNLWMFAAGAVVASIVAVGAFFFNGDAETESAPATATTETPTTETPATKAMPSAAPNPDPPQTARPPASASAAARSEKVAGAPEADHPKQKLPAPRSKPAAPKEIPTHVGPGYKPQEL